MPRAIALINGGKADILLRGNTSTRDFLMPTLDKRFNMVNGLVSEVALVKVSYYDKVFALSDVSVLISSSPLQTASRWVPVPGISLSARNLPD